VTRFFKAFLVALVGSVVANNILLFILRPFVINSAMPLHALSTGLISAFTIIGTIGATIAYAIIRRFSMNPTKIFIWISTVVLLLSFIPDYLIIGVTSDAFARGSWSTTLTLVLMHVVATVIIVWSLVRLWGPRAAQM
jgi:hypothetical protein